jgi:hypothetical protein
MPYRAKKMNQDLIKKDDELESFDIKADMLRAVEKMDKNFSSSDNKRTSLSIRQNTWIPRLIQEIKKSKNLIIEFKVDKGIKEGLKNASYIRKGGVIVKKSDNTVVKWLEEVKLAKSGKALNIATVAIDILSEVALNEKLKEIQNQLERIEEYSEAEHWKSFLDGRSALLAAARIKEKNDHRKELLYDARRSFESAKSKNIVLLNKKKDKINELYEKFDAAKLDNHKVALNILKKTKEIFPVLSMIVQCYRAQAKIYEQLDDLANAEAMSREALEVQADIYEYLYSLIKERALEINRKEKWDSYVKFSKKVFLPGFVYKKISKKELPIEGISPDFYFAKWRRKKKFDLLLTTEQKLIKQHDKLRDELLFLTYEASESID